MKKSDFYMIVMVALVAPSISEQVRDVAAMLAAVVMLVHMFIETKEARENT